MQYNISAQKKNSLDDSDPEVFYDDLLSNHDWSTEKMEIEKSLNKRSNSARSSDITSGHTSDDANAVKDASSDGTVECGK